MSELIVSANERAGFILIDQSQEWKIWIAVFIIESINTQVTDDIAHCTKSEFDDSAMTLPVIGQQRQISVDTNYSIIPFHGHNEILWYFFLKKQHVLVLNYIYFTSNTKYVCLWKSYKYTNLQILRLKSEWIESEYLFISIKREWERLIACFSTDLIH